METISFTFNPNSPFAATMESFLKTVPAGVKVTKSTKPAPKKKARKTVDKTDGYAKEIARRVAGVKSGKIKTRSIDKLLEEA